jgi:hypothetical protein
MVEVRKLTLNDCQARIKAEYVGRALCIGDA